MKNNKKTAVAAIIFAVLLLAFAIFWYFSKPVAKQGSKSITISIIYDDVTKKHTYHTDAQYLGELLNENELVQGENGPYGLFITVADGRQADQSKQEWWCITKNGENVNTGMDTTVIADGEKYELTLKAGW